MEKFLACVFTLLLAVQLNAQPGRCPKIPENYAWNTEEEYRKSEDHVKKTLRWLCQTPLGIDLSDRYLANAYVLEWLAGSPNVLVVVESKKIPFAESHPDLLYTFIHAIALYKMDHPGITDEQTLYKEGFETVAELALQSRELSGARELKALIRAYNKRKLSDYTKEALKGHEKI